MFFLQTFDTILFEWISLLLGQLKILLPLTAE